MNNIDLYKEAIGIVAMQPNFEAIAVEVAKANPKAFVAAANSLGFYDKKNMMEKIKLEATKLRREQGSIPSIKYVRSELNLGLKEAKEYVEAL